MNGSGAVKGQHPTGEILQDHGVDLCHQAIAAPARRQDGRAAPQLGLSDRAEMQIRRVPLERLT